MSTSHEIQVSKCPHKPTIRQAQDSTCRTFLHMLLVERHHSIYYLHLPTLSNSSCRNLVLHGMSWEKQLPGSREAHRIFSTEQMTRIHFGLTQLLDSFTHFISFHLISIHFHSNLFPFIGTFRCLALDTDTSRHDMQRPQRHFFALSGPPEPHPVSVVVAPVADPTSPRSHFQSLKLPRNEREEQEWTMKMNNENNMWRNVVAAVAASLRTVAFTQRIH